MQSFDLICSACWWLCELKCTVNSFFMKICQHKQHKHFRILKAPIMQYQNPTPSVSEEWVTTLKTNVCYRAFKILSNDSKYRGV